MKHTGDYRRLFFACWPDQAVRRELIERRGLIQGLSRRQVPDHNLHLTLLFLGNQPAESVDEIQGVASEISCQSFDLVLDRFGWFPGARVAWLGGPAPPAALALVADLTAAMHRLGLIFDGRAFHPHVTLFRQVAARPAFPQPPQLDWPIHEFALIESIPSAPYQVLRKWCVV
ncbi:MAG: RNA 2',3'-cyclic phosphodiesterase [Wenzhouxiangella sp.]|nr:MAG: RNA 2',3'-cyclic phosphodiesterase [Wenzhouxiangella sp.]